MRLARRKLGWIGVDVGTSVVKIAQVQRGKQGWRLAASAVVPRSRHWSGNLLTATDVLSTLDEMKAAKSLQDGYGGRQVAATLPMTLCDVHRIERDLNRESNALKTIRKSIETATQQSIEHLQCDYWSAPAQGDQPGWTQTLTVPRVWADQLCTDISQAGWTCRAIDGLPQIMARAVRLVHPEAPTEPLAVLDWGSNRATLCFLEKGQPAYLRCLKDSGLRNVFHTLMEELQITELEAQRLLEKYGLSVSPTDGAYEVAQLVQEIVASQLHRLVEEIKRSFSHYQYLRRTSAPKVLYLLGGGATINQLDQRLSEQLGLKAHTWRLQPGGQELDTADPGLEALLAPAIALSALAWEES